MPTVFWDICLVLLFQVLHIHVYIYIYDGIQSIFSPGV
jgi:hypothetical protein